MVVAIGVGNDNGFVGSESGFVGSERDKNENKK